MVIGALTIVIRLHGAASLKDKRTVVKRILARVRNEFNVAAAEVGDNDRIGRGELAIVAVGNEGRFVNSVLDTVLNFVERMQLAEIADHQIEILTL